MKIDLNCDLGEGCGLDEQLMPLITSANISCGMHAGDVSTVMRALQLAKDQGVQVGAHPGFADREHFGRRELLRSESEILHETAYQVGALRGLAQLIDVPVAYIKAHGALYNMACRDEKYARPLVRLAVNLELALMGLPGSCLQHESAGKCPFLAEGFADRRYLPNGRLVPRTEPDAFVHEADEAAEQAISLISTSGVETLCVHGDNPAALVFIDTLRTSLAQRGISIERLGWKTAK